MGITIHYSGKAKSVEAINQLIEELKEVAIILKKEYWLVDEEVKGKMEPSWGHGYGYIPKEEEIQKNGIEFFPKMVSSKCNGFFKIWDEKYADETRKALNEGRKPEFKVDTKMKGIHLNLHPKCETLSFTFDMSNLELASYERYDHKPGAIYYYGGLFCKTQFAGLPIHILVCRILKRTEKYIDYTEISDEADYYNTLDTKIATKSLEANATLIESIGKILKDQAKGTGVQVTRGDELL